MRPILPETAQRILPRSTAMAAGRTLESADGKPEPLRRTTQLLVLMGGAVSPVAEASAHLAWLTADQIRETRDEAERLRPDLPILAGALVSVANRLLANGRHA